jgi:hypothetical protein
LWKIRKRGLKLVIIEVIRRRGIKMKKMAKFISPTHLIKGLIEEKNWHLRQNWLSLQANDQNRKDDKV